MKYLLLSGVAIAALVSGAALAADLPARAIPAAPPQAYAPTFTWAGVYGGVNLGGARRDGGGVLEFDYDGLRPLVLGGPESFRFGDSNSWRLTGGAQVGVNGQWGNVVAGLEADFNWLGGDFRSVVAETDNCEEGPCFDAHGDSPQWLSTVRGRLGFAWDRILVYATGGVAFQEAASVRTEARDFFGSYGVHVSRRNQVGWAAGVGVEWAFVNNMSLGLEYLRADFGSFDVVYDDPLSGRTRSTRVDDNVDLVRLKLNVRF